MEFYENENDESGENDKDGEGGESNEPPTENDDFHTDRRPARERAHAGG